MGRNQTHVYQFIICMVSLRLQTLVCMLHVMCTNVPGPLRASAMSTSAQRRTTGGLLVHRHLLACLRARAMRVRICTMQFAGAFIKMSEAVSKIRACVMYVWTYDMLVASNASAHLKMCVWLVWWRVLCVRMWVCSDARTWLVVWSAILFFFVFGCFREYLMAFYNDKQKPAIMNANKFERREGK